MALHPKAKWTAKSLARSLNRLSNRVMQDLVVLESGGWVSSKWVGNEKNGHAEYSCGDREPHWVIGHMELFMPKELEAAKKLTV